MNYLVTFAAASQNSDKIINEIRKFDEWGEVTPNSFFVVSNENAGKITERLQVYLGPKDSIAVFAVSRPWASHCDPIVEDLILSQIGQDEDWNPRDFNHETQGRE